MTRLYLLTISLLVVVVSTTTYLFLERSVENELDAHTRTTIKEFRLAYESYLRDKKIDSANIDSKLDKAAWEEISDRVESTKEYPRAWRVWKVDWNRVVFESGPQELFSRDYPLLTTNSDTQSLPGGRRARTEFLSQGYAVGVVLDGSARIEVLGHYETFAAALLAIAVLITLGLGFYMIRSTSHMLRDVAARARAVRDPTSATVELEVDDAPEEIRDVVDALRELFSNVRNESERNRVFYASMAHELRSPIQNLVGETEVALFAKREESDYRRVLESNLDELRDLGDAIDNLVTICSERRPMSADSDLEDFDLLDEANIRLAREKSQAARRGVELSVEGQGDLSVRGDREGLLRALRNLAANAIQWSPDGSTVSVRLVGSEDRIDITVDDAGPGVPVDLREAIFTPFVRGPSLNGQRIGYGLGLAIVRSAVDGQGGTIEVTTSGQGGARFRVVLPRTQRPPQS